MLLPELPAYLDSMGGQNYKGAIIGLFTLSACISRPFSGRLADTIGRVPVIIFGTVVAVVTNSLYIVVPGILGFLILRLIHGLTIGFNSTGATAYISDIVPPEKRGEAMGFFGLMNNVGAGLAPILGSFVSKNYGMDAMFLTASVLALGSASVFWNINETIKNKQAFKLNLLKLEKQDLAEKRVWLPAIVMFLVVFSFGTILTVGFDLAEQLHSSNKGLILMIMTLSSIGIRVIAGKFSDRYGRKSILLIGLTILCIGLILLANAQNLTNLYIAISIVGIANGINNPTLFAWVTDWGNPKNRGRAISTLFIALETGVGVGSFVSAAVYENKFSNIPIAFYMSAGLVVLAIFILSFTWKYKPKLILE